MFITGSFCPTALVAAVALQPAMADPPAVQDEVQQLRALVADMQKQIDALKAESPGHWLTQERASEIRGLVQDVLADADTRASLLQGGAVAGRENGFFFIASPDGNYLLRIGGQMQLRAVYNHQDDAADDDTRYGFEMRRVKVDFRGHVVDPTWQYYVEAEAPRDSGMFTLGENGWIQKDFGNGMKVRFGQFKPFFLREESISSRRLLTVERSLVNAQFTAGTSQGVQIEYSADRWRAFGAFIDGAGERNSPWDMEDTEYAFTGRAEYLMLGEWRDVEDDVGFRDGGTAVLFGGGVLCQREEFGTATTDELTSLALTGDVTWKQSGMSLMGALVYRNLDEDDGADLDQVGLVIRGAYFIRDDVELYAMYEWGDLDVDAVDDLSAIYIGVNKYFAKHQLKWQSDIGYGFNEVADEWAVESAGWREDSSGSDGQVVVRSQFQLLF